jgi:nucleotide-binding universal stress UspA family protein
MNTIVLALDFESQSSKIIDEAKKYALAFQATLHLLHISTLVTKSLNFDQSVGDGHKEANTELSTEKRLLKRLCLNLNKEGIEANYSILEGEVSRNVIEEAERLEAELVIVGLHQRSFLMRSFVKSASEETLQKIKIPILFIPLEA